MHANIYTGGTLVNAGPIKMAKPRAWMPSRAIHRDGTASLVMNAAGEQIANSAIVTFNGSARWI